MPAFLAAAGVESPAGIPGRNFLPLLQGKPIPWRDGLLYEYYWEKNFPQTPTMHAIRTEQYKYIRPYGVWDVEELYDLQSDPQEIVNLIRDPQHQQIVKELKGQMFQVLKETGGMSIPLFVDRDAQMNRRLKSGTPQAAFPPQMIQE